MYIHDRPGFKTCYRLIITVLAIISIGIEFLVLGAGAWRIFTTWTLLLTATYFLISSIKTAFYIEEGDSKTFCPMLQGATIIANLVLLGMEIFAMISHLALPDFDNGAAFMSSFLIPALVFLDWLLFSPKGNWRPIDPFYWLALPIIYLAWILISASFLGDRTKLLYPYDFLDPSLVTLDNTLWSIILILVLILLAGYILYIVDFIMSGRLAKCIVLPHIRTIVIEEEISMPATKAISADEQRAERDVVPESKHASGPASKQVTKNAPEPTTKNTPKHNSKQNFKQVSKQSSKPGTKPAAKVAAKPAKKSVPKPVSSSSSKSNPKPTKKTAQKVSIENRKDEKSASNIHGSSKA